MGSEVDATVKISSRRVGKLCTSGDDVCRQVEEGLLCYATSHTANTEHGLLQGMNESKGTGGGRIYMCIYMHTHATHPGCASGL